MQCAAVFINLIFICFIICASTYALDSAILEVTLYSNVNGKFQIQNEGPQTVLKLTGYFSPVGPLSDVEGAIYQVNFCFVFGNLCHSVC